MAKRQTLRHPVSIAFSSSGSFSLDLSNKPQTITGMWIVVRPTSITSTTTGSYNDPWDRIIQSMTLSGAGHTYFQALDMRNFYFHQRHFLQWLSPKRPARPADSLTTAAGPQFGYYVHFGVSPLVFNGATGRLDENRWDLSAGIAPSTGGNLTLTGNFNSGTNVMGSGVTLNAASIDVYLDCVLPEAGDPLEAYLPRALPAWLQTQPSLSSTSGAFGTFENVPVGSLLHSVTAMTTAGSNAPRSSTVLNSLRLQDVLGSNTVFEYGQGSAAADSISAEIITQQGDGFPLVDDPAAIGTFTVGTQSDSGMIHLDVAQYAVRGDPIFGLDLRRVGTGAVQIQYGVATTTNAALQFFYRRYDYNMAHPSNAGR
jgi:hypothetical protein